MGVIFPLSWPGKIVLALIAVALGLIFWKLHKAVKAKEELQNASKSTGKSKPPAGGAA